MKMRQLINVEDSDIEEDPNIAYVPGSQLNVEVVTFN